MRKDRPHIHALLFGSILILPLLAIVVLQLGQTYLSHTAYERMDEASIVTVVVPEQKLVWREEGREVTIDGEYFDLVSFHLKDGIYTLTGVYDHEETAVSNMLQLQTSNQRSLIHLLLIGQCFAALVVYLLHFGLVCGKTPVYGFFRNLYRFLFSRAVYSPPRFTWS